MTKYVIEQWITETKKVRLEFEAPNMAAARAMVEENVFDWDDADTVDSKGWDFGEIEGPKKA